MPQQATKSVTQEPKGMDMEPNLVIVNTILGYMMSSMESSNKESIQKMVCREFCGREILEAKELLWKKCNFGEYIQRKTTPQRTDKEANTMDILNELYRLDEENILPDILVNSREVKRFPSPQSEECVSENILRKLKELEKRVCTNEAKIYSNEIDTKILRDRLIPSKKIEPAFSWQNVGNKSANISTATGTTEHPSLTHDPGRLLFSEALSLPPPQKSSPRQPPPQETTSAKPRSLSRPVVKGMAPSSSSAKFKGAPPPKRSLFVYRVQKEVQEKDIEAYIADELKVNDCKTVLKSREEAKYNSFMVEVPVDRVDELLSPDKWPLGVCVRKFFIKNNNQGYNNNDKKDSTNQFVSSKRE